MGKGKIKIEADAAGAARRVVRMERRLDEGEKQLVQLWGEIAKEALADAAPGSVGRGVEIETVGTVLYVTVHRYSEEGYDYAPVTRFGHRVERIYPVHAKALKTPWGPRAWVRGYHPDHDWAEDAMPIIQASLGPGISQLKRKITAEVRF